MSPKFQFQEAITPSESVDVSVKSTISFLFCWEKSKFAIGGLFPGGKTVTSIEKELGYKVDYEEVKGKIKKHFELIFECDFVEA